ncbi:MAG: SCO family protein [Verrucomicrobiota bacterium]
MRYILHNAAIFFFFNTLLCADLIEGRVLSIDTEGRTFEVTVTEPGETGLMKGEPFSFRVGRGDVEIDYVGRLIRGDAKEYGGRWNLEQIFPLDGIGAKPMADVNKQLRDQTSMLSRRKYVKEGEYIPNFAMIDQKGKFLQIRELQGHAFVMNFIFTRCTVPAMCPASSERMSILQDKAREAELDNLHFVTITFDPEFDSPGILRQYAAGYGIEQENFHLLTGTRQVVDDLLRQFGILTMEEDGTINHTMATLLVDSKGRVAFRKEGSKWTVEEFFEEAQKL